LPELFEVGSGARGSRGSRGSKETDDLACRVAVEGSLHPDFQDVAAAFERQLQNQRGGGAVCVYHRGQCVVDLWGGYRDQAGTPWKRDTLAPSFSTTKGVTSTLLHMMVDRQLVDYDAPVAEYWPEFAQAGKSQITVRHVLSHQSGLYHIRHMIDHALRMCDWEHMIEAIERTEPIHPPGARTGYHGFTYGFLIGEILQRVTGEDFSTLVRKELAEPLELDGLYVGAPEDALPRAAELIWPEFSDSLRENNVPALPEWLENAAAELSGLLGRGFGALGIKLDLASIAHALAPRGIANFDFSSHETLRAPIPAGNGLFTARSLGRMYAALAGGGEIDGVRLLSKETLIRATERQTEAEGRAVLPFDMVWRLGYHGVATSRGFPRHAFGHFGFGGSGAWADPTLDLSVAMTVNCGMGTPFGDIRIVRIGGAALACAERRTPELASTIPLTLERLGGAALSLVRGKPKAPLVH
jgi:CubicO group peptidase (beta-lactamase class C family)